MSNRPTSIKRRCLVYGLRRPGSVVRYVGQTTKTLAKRLQHHICVSKHKDFPVRRWIRKHNSNIEIVLLVNNAEWNVDEIRIIAELRASGSKLLNCTPGGSGLLGYKHSLETREKIKLKATGRKLTDDVKLKISESGKNKIVCQETRDRLSKSLKGKTRKPLSLGHKLKLSKACKGKTLTQEHRDKISASHRRRCHVDT